MKKLALTLSATALLVGSLAVSANAQSVATGAAGLHAQIQNATPIVKQAACRGFGPHCAPGWTWVCGYGHCWCRACI
jgi:hypothetical protein